MTVTLLLSTALYTAGVSGGNENVLVVHSYHQGFFWTDNLQKGLAEQLDSENISNRVFYLDTKRLQTPQYFDQLESLFRTKFEQEKFKAIIVSDNNALALMQSLSKEIGETPVIFGGINNYSTTLHSKIRATGIPEHSEVAGNIRLIKSFQPDIEKIVVIIDHSQTGNAARKVIEQYLTKNPADRALIKVIAPSNNQTLHQITEKMTRQSALLFWIYFRDENGEMLGIEDWAWLKQHSKAPIYMLHNAGFGHGSVGGIINDGYLHGLAVGAKALEVLHNPEAPLPDISLSNPQLKLDYQALKHWDLDSSGVLSGSLYNKPIPFWLSYLQEFKVYLMFIVIMILTIVSLLYYTKRLNSSKRQLRKNQALLETVFDQSNLYLGIFDQHGRLISSNSRMQEMLFSQDFNIERPLWQFGSWHADSANKIFQYFSLERISSGIRFEGEVLHHSLGSRILDISLKALPVVDPSHQEFLVEAQDITSRKETEEKLFESEASFRHYYEKQPVMMVTLDENNRIQAVNRFSQELLGYQSMELLGHPLKEFYIDDNALTARQLLLQPKPSELSVWRREVQYKRADGQSIWIRENIRPLTETQQLLIVGEDISETRDLADQLAYQAQHDVLTKAFNRNYFEQQLLKAMQEIEGHYRTHAMLFIDLDQLKVINDTVGHEAGDEAIVYCAQLIQEVLPFNGVLSRMGGDEFGVLLRDCTEVSAIKVSQTIINTLNDNPFVLDKMRLNLSCSIGIRLIDHTAISPQMVHAQADTACYAAKEEGRNRYQLYHVDDAELNYRQQQMESVNLVHEALSEQRMELFAQRILGLDESNANRIHLEILVRIKKRDGEYLSPGVFMPASERYNIAHLVDRHVITQTMQWLDSNPEKSALIDMCSINISGQSLGNIEFISTLTRTISDASFPSSKICLEITETAAIQNVEQAKQAFTRLKSLGCLIALDDFGSGLSSFGYLKSLPVDIVKIDGLFVRDIDENEMDLIMVRSINDLAQQMGKITVAEFVESPAIIECLCELGVDYGQGYEIGMPKPLPELIDEMIAQQQSRPASN